MENAIKLTNSFRTQNYVETKFEAVSVVNWEMIGLKLSGGIKLIANAFNYLRQARILAVGFGLSKDICRLLFVYSPEQERIEQARAKAYHMRFIF